MKMKIIGHRGAAGLALENTLESIKAGINSGADYIEIDTRLTFDHQVVLCHNPDLKKISNDERLVSDLTLAKIKDIILHNNQTVPTLEEVLVIIKDFPVIIELKEDDMIFDFLKVLDKFPKANVTIISFKHQEIEKLKSMRPELKVYLASLTDPHDVVIRAKSMSANGVAINFWTLNPISYLYARSIKLDMMVYTINNKFLAYFIHFLYPKVMICTDNPQFFVKRRRSNAS